MTPSRKWASRRVAGKLSSRDSHAVSHESVMELEPVQIPIDGALDLHVFLPGEIKALVPAYLAACLENGIHDVRIIHGKGTGSLRRTVHAVLARLELVVSFQPASEEQGGWGATLVLLKRERER